MFSKLLHVLWNRNYEDICTTGEEIKSCNSEIFLLPANSGCLANFIQKYVFNKLVNIYYHKFYLAYQPNIYNTDFQGKIHKR